MVVANGKPSEGVIVGKSALHSKEIRQRVVAKNFARVCLPKKQGKRIGQRASFLATDPKMRKVL
ncbi:hypothetical protein MPNT_10053 [Candidatus Methylacidithermus pantelleriae]|uniref:Uncharacterized protein n=1 Tax=Candidatus Methylacidithermus pantelleriae TaxID=2744239 RepID=A0A8J2BLT1_9BACT|nr:hypothetical protein MPNT_10053 [Candidatus Methylacidithermus pantelleriae]